MKISAKGMFKRLGYERERILNERFILYRKPRGTGLCQIQFDLKGCHPHILSIKEILAIQKQIDELGGEFTYDC